MLQLALSISLSLIAVFIYTEKDAGEYNRMTQNQSSRLIPSPKLKELIIQRRISRWCYLVSVLVFLHWIFLIAKN